MGPTLFQHGWWSLMRTLQSWPVLKKKKKLEKNFHLQSARVSSERAFSLLKARWRCSLKMLKMLVEDARWRCSLKMLKMLVEDVEDARWRCSLKRLDKQTENISEVIISCFALYNFSQLENEVFIDKDRVAGHRRNAPRGNQNQPGGKVVRNAIKNNLKENVWKQTK